MRTVYGIEVHPSFPIYHEVIEEDEPSIDRIIEILNDYREDLKDLTEEVFENNAEANVLIMDSKSGDMCTKAPCIPIMMFMTQALKRFPILMFFYNGILTFGIKCESYLDFEPGFENLVAHRDIEFACYTWKNL